MKWNIEIILISNITIMMSADDPNVYVLRKCFKRKLLFFCHFHFWMKMLESFDADTKTFKHWALVIGNSEKKLLVIKLYFETLSLHHLFRLTTTFTHHPTSRTSHYGQKWKYFIILLQHSIKFPVSTVISANEMVSEKRVKNHYFT